MLEEKETAEAEVTEEVETEEQWIPPEEWYNIIDYQKYNDRLKYYVGKILPDEIEDDIVDRAMTQLYELYDPKSSL